MTPVTRQEVLGLYRKIFRIAKKWQSASGQIEETIKEKEYIKNEAKMLFRKNKNVSGCPYSFKFLNDSLLTLCSASVVRC